MSHDKQSSKYRILIKNASIVNEGEVRVLDIFIKGERIKKIHEIIDLPSDLEINANGLYLFPGMIDDQVHFREPGYTNKGTIYSESRAAVAGGITSYMEMPNTYPNTTTLDLLEDKFAIAAKSSFANFSFFLGITKSNIEEALLINNESVCGLSDDGLYFDGDDTLIANHPDFLEQLFKRSDSLIALHCEDENRILKNTELFRKQFGDDIPIHFHPLIRDERACFEATSRVIQLAELHKARVHILHVSTAIETNLFRSDTAIRNKRISGEACVHHLWFSDNDYKLLGNEIKWNPAIKKKSDKIGLLEALKFGQLDIIATDHAPHLLSDKAGNYFQNKSGAPLVQHALPILLEMYHAGCITLEQIVEKTSHNVAEIYRIVDRGYIREGYYADFTLIDINSCWIATNENTLYRCGWSPFNGQRFKSKIIKTFVNGSLVYDDGIFSGQCQGKRLEFSRDRF